MTSILAGFACAAITTGAFVAWANWKLRNHGRKQ
jgi:hypothetical protein